MIPINCNIIRIATILSLLFNSWSASAQQTPRADSIPQSPEQIFSEPIYSIGDESLSFPGGDIAKFNFINKNLRYPQECKEKGIQGIVWLSVVIDKQGNITEVTVHRAPPEGKALEVEAIRLYKQMPRWSPGRLRNEPINMRISEKVRFVLK